jgi:hypothetical protein
MIAQVCAALEPLEVGRPAAGHLQYVSVLAALAGLISVLNARSPGSGAWAILMGLLVLVLLIPWLESFLLLRNAAGLGRLRLVAPWSLFYGLLVVAGVTNYLPTRYGPAALVLAAGFGLEYLALAHTEWNPARRGDAWPLVAWFQALAAALADGRARRRAEARNGLEAVWLWFRDHWGVVWALRIQERFNRAAEAAAWPIRLSWYGVVPVPAGAGPERSRARQEPRPPGTRLGGPPREGEAPAEPGFAPVDVPDDAATTLLGLLRRFATAERLAAEAGPSGLSS